MEIVIRRAGSLIDISPDGVRPLPSDVVDLLVPELTYNHRRQLRGAEAYDPVTGLREGVITELRSLYRMEQGRLTTGSGFLRKLQGLLTEAGHEVCVRDLSPARVRPTCYQEDWDNVRRLIAFRTRQEECLRAIATNPGGLVHAATGFGKTFLFLAIALLYPHARIHIVAKPTDVVRRIVWQLASVLSCVGQVGAGQRNFSRVTVFTAASLHHSDGDCDILIGDEAHQLMAPVYSESLGRIYRQSRNFAFTATPTGRFDGADTRLEMFFGPTIFHLSYPNAVELGLTVPIFVRWLPIRLEYNPAQGKTTQTSRKRWGIWRNLARNQALAAAARSYSEDHQVLIMVETIEHAIYLGQQLPEFQLCYGESFSAEDTLRYQRSKLLPETFVPMTSARRSAMREAFEQGTLKKVIATDVWSTGVDFQPLQTLFRADGRDSEILATQIPGRTSRLHEGKEHGELVDCVDFFDANLKRKSQRRKRHYAAQGWAQDWPRAERQLCQ